MSEKHVAEIRAAAAQAATPAAPERPTAVYWLYDSKATLLYVGMTNNPIQRFAEHSRDKAWWPHVYRYSVRWFDTRARAEAAETSAILNDGPLLNVEHQPRNKRDGGLPAVPFYLGKQFLAALDRFVAEMLPSAKADEREQLVSTFVNGELHEKIFIFFNSSGPKQHHPLDIAALLAVVESFGPLVAPADPKSAIDAVAEDDEDNR